MKFIENQPMESFEKIEIYYFTGTGNSKNVALWFAQLAAENSAACQIVNIANIDQNRIEPPEKGALVVIVSPVHGFNYPPIVLKFISRFPKGNNRVVLLNTRAGMLIGNWITPGISGITFFLSAFILFLKGFTISGIFPVDMPSNWISIHPGLNERTVKFLHEKNKERVKTFAEKMLRGKQHFRPLLEFYDIFFAPIALGYYLVGRFFFSKTYYASRDCNNCDLCLKACPVKAIIKRDDRPFWTFKCESCMKCMSYCPQKAIETGHGYIAAFVLILFPVILAAVYKYFGLYFFPIEHEFLKFVLESGLFLGILWAWYRVVHWLLRYKIIERLTVFTSLTRYKWWGRRYRALFPHAK